MTTAIQEPRSREDRSDRLRDDAVKRLRKKQDFRAHLLVYTLFNAVLWAIWAIATPDAIVWPIFPMAAWGVGLVMNAWDVYGRRPITERDVQAEMERLRRA